MTVETSLFFNVNFYSEIMKRVINYGKGENKFHPFVVRRGIHGVWLVHNNNYCTPPSWWTIIGRKVVIVFLIACLSLIGPWWLSTQTPYCFQSVHFQFADSWTATIAQSTPRTTEGILSVWDTTDTRDDGLRMTMRGVVGSLVSFLGNSSPDTTRDTAPLQVAFVFLVLKEAVGACLLYTSPSPRDA